MYVIFCVLCAIIEFALAQYHTEDFNFRGLHPWGDRHSIDRIRPNKYKLTGNAVCCCKSTQTLNSKFDYVISVVKDNEAINCSEKYYDVNCYCYLKPSSADAQGNVNDSCTSSNIYIYIGIVAVILLIGVLIITILMLRTRTGFKIDKYCMVQPSRSKKRITIVRRSLGSSNERSGDTISRTKYGSLRSREYSHIYHSLDNVHMATEDSTSFINQEKNGKNPYCKPKKDSIKRLPARLLLNGSNVIYEEPTLSASGADEHDTTINKRRPYPLPRDNMPPASNISKYDVVSSTKRLPPPPKTNLRPAPKTPTNPIMTDTSPLTTELIHLFNKRRLNENESMASQKFAQMALPPPPPRKTNELARAPASRFDNNEDEDWAYEEFVNVSIYDVQ